MGKSNSKHKKNEESDECQEQKGFFGKSTKALLLGDLHVGKTSFLQRLLNDKYTANCEPSIAPYLESKQIDEEHFIDFWDTAGNPAYRALSKTFISGGRLFFLFYDITNKESFDALPSFYQMAKEKGEKDALFIVVGAKCDLKDKEAVSEEEARKYATSIGAEYWLCSSCSNEGVKDNFDKLIEKYGLEKKKPKLEEKPCKKKKPVIYLYPTQPMKISVKLEKQKFTTVYPKFTKETQWEVEAKPDGNISINGKNYPYLFWETMDEKQMDFSEGFIVKAEDAENFLEEKLDILGLNYIEKTDFITFWLPILLENKTSICSFQFKNYVEKYPMKIEPNPETLIRIFLAIKKIDSPDADFEAKIKEQKLEKCERKGFTVVEWGGCNINV